MVRPDAGDPCLDPTADQDADGIPNILEGCKEGRDSDGDKLPDWKDRDSDGDGLLDGEEDRNRDGKLGCCLLRCNEPDARWQQANCTLTADGCGAGQRCVSGICAPAAAFNCAEGETSPIRKDTFGDGRLDNERGEHICREATKDNPHGTQTVLEKTSPAAQGDWRLALGKSVRYSEYTIASPGQRMAAAALDFTGSGEQVAGFVASRGTVLDGVQAEWRGINASLRAGLKAELGGVLTQLSSGTSLYTHDLYQSVQQTYLEISLSSARSVSAVRDAVVATLLGKKTADLSNRPQSFGVTTSQLVLKFSTVKRVEFRRDPYGQIVKDASGKPLSTGDKTKWRLLVLGAVAAESDYQNPKQKTGFIADDLGNGTALAVYHGQVKGGCDHGTITRLPEADIIWVVDETIEQLRTDRNWLGTSGYSAVSLALASGLVFRLGVTNVCDPAGSYKAAVGKFCSQLSSSTTDMGGGDRFLLPSEQTIFLGCINNPPGYEWSKPYGLVNAGAAVTRHLPRAANNPARIQTSASVAVIVVSDGAPASLASAIGAGNTDACTLPASNQAAVDLALQPYQKLLSGSADSEARATLHVIGGVCGNTCKAGVAHGYRELSLKLGGLSADICQKSLTHSISAIVDDIVGQASPVVLDDTPISSTLAATLDGAWVPRSRTNGFDYRPAHNSLVLINTRFRKGSQVTAAYKRWQ